MANTIRIKRKTTTGMPLVADVEVSELVHVLPDKQVVLKNSDDSFTKLGNVEYTQLRLNTGFPAYISKTINIEDIRCNSNSIIDVFMDLKSDSENELEFDNVMFSTIAKTESFDLIISSTNNQKIGGKFDLKYKIY